MTLNPQISRLLRDPGIAFGSALLIVLIVCSLLAPYLGTRDPIMIDPISRLRSPSAEFWFGTDMVGRDIYSRAVYGAKTSLAVAVLVAAFSLVTGLTVGLVASYVRWLDPIVSRVMDGIMAIPGILLAIAMITLSGASMFTVVFAITIPEIPRVVRLVRSVVLAVREEPYVEAAIGLGTRTFGILVRHIMPNVVAPLIVQGTYIAASAMLLEAILSFLGIGLPPEVPSWGSIMADGRAVFQIAPWIIIAPGIMLGLSILAINVVGDGLRDTLDPRIAKRV
jgi:peptide/nickel transport system permease protein